MNKSEASPKLKITSTIANNTTTVVLHNPLLLVFNDNNRKLNIKAPWKPKGIKTRIDPIIENKEMAVPTSLMKKN